MNKELRGLGQTVELSPLNGTLHTPPSQRLIDRLLRQSHLLAEDWDALPSGARHRILECREQRQALEQLVKYGLLSRYQSGRIEAGTTFGLVLGSYRVLDRIGAGGMAVVFKAEHMDLRHNVAIKVLPPTTKDDSGLETRFFAEMRVVARLRHPNIVAATDAGKAVSDDGNSLLRYLVMEYVPGEDLEEAVRHAGPMCPARACSIAYQVASALSETHKYGIVHRDIKPSNVMVTPADQAKLLDFGLTRHFGNRMTVPGTVLGTIDYMAPEQGRDASNVDIRADIFGLGATLYWCLTGKLPFPFEGNPVEALTKRLTAPSPSIRQVNSDLPADLDAVVARMMAHRPEDRYADPEAVMQALLTFVQTGGGKYERLAALPIPEPWPTDTVPETVLPKKFHILIVDDESRIRNLCRQLFEVEGAIVEVAANGSQGLALAAEGVFDLVLLDVAMPDMPGTEVLVRLRQQHPNSHLKVLMFSGHATPEEMSEMFARGADDFLTKPFSTALLAARVQNLLRLKAAQDKAATLNRYLAGLNARLEQEVEYRGGDEHAVRNALVLAVATAAELREGRGDSHPKRMQQYCRTLAEAAARNPAFAPEINGDFAALIAICAPLHDLGRAALPDHILMRSGSTTIEEQLVLETHTVVGSELFKVEADADGSLRAFLQMANDVSRHHHERYDGTGYPDRLAGAAIPLSARLVAIADAYDTFRCRRFNKPALSHIAAMQILSQDSPGWFDPGVLEVFGRVSDKFETIFRGNPD